MLRKGRSCWMHGPRFIKEFNQCPTEKGFELMHDCSDSMKLSRVYIIWYLWWFPVTVQGITHIFLIKHFNITQLISVSWYSLVRIQDWVFRRSNDFLNTNTNGFQHDSALPFPSAAKNLQQKFLTGTSVNIYAIVQQCVLWQICLNIFHWDKGVAKKNDTIVNFPCFVTLYSQI